VKKVGKAKLNIWIRDEHCKVVKNLNVAEGLDWVEVRYAAKPEGPNNPNVVTRAILPKGDAHVEVEVPPGMYIVAGHICMQPEDTFNGYTDKAVVLAKGNEVSNVDLIISTVATCAWQFTVPFVREAVRRRLPDPEIMAVVRNIIAVSEVPVAVARETIDNAIKTAKLKPEDPRMVPYNKSLSLLKEIR
jgi:hypothetical protein